MPKPCTCEKNRSFINCPAHDAAMRTPAEIEAHVAALRAERAERNADRRRGWFGGTAAIWDELTELAAEGRAS